MSGSPRAGGANAGLRSGARTAGTATAGTATAGTATAGTATAGTATAGTQPATATADALAGRRRAEELSDLSSALHAAGTIQGVVDETSAWLSRTLGSTSVVLSVPETDEPMLRRYFAGSAPSASVRARYLRTPTSEDSISARVVSSGTALWYRDHRARGREYPAFARGPDVGGVEALAVLPLRRATGVPFAALALGWGTALEFEVDLVTTLNKVGAIVAIAVEQRRIAELGQSSLVRLEERLLGTDTRTTRLIVRGRHRGADTGVNIGGDWYDTVDMRDGRVAVAVGDVVGRGLEAVRAALRLRGGLGLAALEVEEPSEALAAVDRYAETVRGAHCATTALAFVDPCRAELSYACAGHPPPLLASPSGEVAFLEEGRSWPLGIGLAQPRPRGARAPFPPGSLLILYTDGLVERRREPIEVGLGRLAQVVADNWSLPLRRLKDKLFMQLVGDAAEDDVALVVVRHVGACPGLFADAFVARHDEQGRARQRLRAWLEGVGLSTQDCAGVVLAVSEAISNAIDHGSDNDPTQIVTVEIAQEGAELVVSVGDRGHWQPGLEALLEGRGRGHLIMGGLAEEVDIDLHEGGTVVTLRFDCRSGQLV